MNYADYFASVLADTDLHSWADYLLPKEAKLDGVQQGNFNTWRQVLEQLPSINTSFFQLNASQIVIGSSTDCDDKKRNYLEKELKKLQPWRKGPFSLFGIGIDSEWRSGMKWDRVAPHLPSLKGQRVLDIGCNNGYYLLRMVGCGVKYAIGADKTLLYAMQFLALKNFLKDINNVFISPFSIENLRLKKNQFDTVFSMGVLYHHRDPIEHLKYIANILQESGLIVLETLIVEEAFSELFIPKDRYACMKNVRHIPSCTQVSAWLEESGFREVICVDKTKTTIEEQRATNWMTYKSLPDFLDKENSNYTIEGYPAPQRAIFLAFKV